MADPAIVACAAGAWTKVATNVTAGVIWAKDNPGQMLQTYRKTGEAAPTLINEGMPLQIPGQEISSLTGVDVYIWAKENAGSVRIDL
jgi:hypothetical protein